MFTAIKDIIPGFFIWPGMNFSCSGYTHKLLFSNGKPSVTQLCMPPR
jgi:hypothetical protein